MKQAEVQLYNDAPLITIGLGLWNVDVIPRLAKGEYRNFSRRSFDDGNGYDADPKHHHAWLKKKSDNGISGGPVNLGLRRLPLQFFVCPSKT